MNPTVAKYLVTPCLLALVACGGGGTSDDFGNGPDPDGGGRGQKIDPEQARLVPGLSCQQFKDYIAETFTQRYLATSTPCIGIACPIPTPVAVVSETDQPGFVSDTNVQEAGIDEADTVKADSHGNLFVVDQQKLHIIDGYEPEQMHVIATLSFEQGIRSILLDEERNRLIVFLENLYSIASVPGNDKSAIKFFNIQDLSAPVEISQFQHSGFAGTQRYIDGELYYIVSDSIQNPIAYNNAELTVLLANYYSARDQQNQNAMAQSSAQLGAFVKAQVSNVSINEFLPGVFITDANGAETEAPAISCTDIYAPGVSVYPRIVSIYKFDFDGNRIDTIATISSYFDTYVSTKNIYLYQNSNNWWWSAEQNRETAIHQFSIESANLQYVGVGVIPGNVNNRFSMSEHNDNLRVVTNDVDLSGIIAQPINYLHILAPNNQNKLEIVGKTQPYAQGERIFSARFIGDRGFVVTFRRIDPLFAFDLSDPTAPTLVGELEIPGFSEYIHPVGENRLLTIGQNGDADGLLPGVRLQLFDVSVLSDPVLLHSYVPTAEDGSLSYAWSAASYDHHAFTYIDSTKILTIPLQISAPNSGLLEFSGFITMAVEDANGFTELGRIDHSDYFNPVLCLSLNCPQLLYAQSINPTRTVVIHDADNEFLYTFSSHGVIAADTDDPATVLKFVYFGDYQNN